MVKIAKTLNFSKRGEKEITDINNIYLEQDKMIAELLDKNYTWLDTGTFDSLHQAGSYIRLLERRQGLKVGCPEEIAWRKGWIKDDDLEKIAKDINKSGYGKYLFNILNDPLFEKSI